MVVSAAGVKYDAEVKRRNNAALRALAVSKAAADPATHAAHSGLNGFAQWLQDLLLSQPPRQPPSHESVTIKICYQAVLGQSACQ